MLLCSNGNFGGSQIVSSIKMRHNSVLGSLSFVSEKPVLPIVSKGLHVSLAHPLMYYRVSQHLFCNAFSQCSDFIPYFWLWGLELPPVEWSLWVPLCLQCCLLAETL